MNFSCWLFLDCTLLLTWASFRGKLLPKFTLCDYFEWIQCPENNHSAKLGLEFTCKILVKEILLTYSRIGDNLLSELTSSLIKYTAGENRVKIMYSQYTSLGLLNCKKKKGILTASSEALKIQIKINVKALCKTYATRMKLNDSHYYKYSVLTLIHLFGVPIMT